MGGELGNGICIDVLLSSSAMSSPSFTLNGNDDLYTNIEWKSWRFLVFADFSARPIVKRKEKLRIFIYASVLHVRSVVSGSVRPICKA